MNRKSKIHEKYYRVGIDIGGTFTDIVLLSDDGKIFTKKVSSTPEEYSYGAVKGLETLIKENNSFVKDIQESDIRIIQEFNTESLINKFPVLKDRYLHPFLFNLDIRDDYFTTTIDPASDGYDEYIASTNWKLFRILLSDFDVIGDGSVSWSDVRNIRLWVDDFNSSYNYDNSINESNNTKALKIAKLEIVGNEWLELGSTNIDNIASVDDDDFFEEPYFAVTVLNTHDNRNEYEPPNSEVEGEIDEITGIQMKEQSLVLSFKKSDDALDYGGIDSDEGLAIKKSFSILPNDKKNSFFAYEKLSMYVHGSPDNIGGNWNLNDSSLVDLLFRFGKDDQYYEIRQPVFEGWNNKNHIDINIDKLTQYKLEISLEEYEDIGIDGCSNNLENGFGSCLDTLSFSYYCESSNPNFEFINQNSCESYLNLSSVMQSLFDPNSDDYISEPSDNFNPSDLEQRTENNYQYDYGEPFEDLNEDKTKEIIHKLLKDEFPKPGSFKNRKSNAPEKGKTTLLEIKNA